MALKISRIVSSRSPIWLSIATSRVATALSRWDGAGFSEESDRDSDRLHRTLPALIVLVSLAAATMGWQASVQDERATQKDEVSRQDFISLQQIRLQRTKQVDADINLFGTFEQYYLLGQSARDQARELRGDKRRTLAQEGGADSKIADTLENQILYPAAVRSPRNPYDVRAAIVEAESSDPGLSSLEPNVFRAQAKADRTRALHLVGLAALFVAALVFFTCAAVTQSKAGTWRQLSLLDHRGSPVHIGRGAPRPGWLRGPRSVSWGFTTCGLTLALAAGVLFPIVRLG